MVYGSSDCCRTKTVVVLSCSVHPTAIEDERSRKAFQNVVRLFYNVADSCLEGDVTCVCRLNWVKPLQKRVQRFSTPSKGRDGPHNYYFSPLYE